MSSITSSVQDFIARQPRLAWRRQLIRSFIRFVGFKILWKMRVDGLDIIPDEGPTLIMMNHTTLLDPVLYMGIVTRRFVVPMTKIENVHHPILGPIIAMYGAYPVNRGEVDRKALMNSIELIKSGQLVLLAPEGHRHPEGLAQPKDGLAYIAAKSNPVIVPTSVSGSLDWKDNLFHFRRTHITIKFGRPFRFKIDSRPRIPREELTAMMDEAMYQLALCTDESLRGVYSDLSQATTRYIEFA